MEQVQQKAKDDSGLGSPDTVKEARKAGNVQLGAEKAREILSMCRNT